MKVKKQILSATLCAPFFVSGPAWAQTGAQGQESVTTPRDVAKTNDNAIVAQTATPAAKPDSTLEEIVVTAQRRGENLQKVPIAITAVTAETALRLGVTGTSSLQIAAPAVTLSTSPGAVAVLTIRGVTSLQTVADEPAASLYVDGQYLTGTPAFFFDFNNVERIEVLKGPQGTLFGRNSAGGSIQIITKEPQFKPQGSASVGYSNYSTIKAQVYGTTGLSNTIAIDVAALLSDQGKGWGRNVFTGNSAYKGEQQALRSKLLWEPDSDTKVVAALGYARGVTPQVQGFATPSGRVDLAGIGGLGFYDFDASFDSTNRNIQKTGSLNASHDFGGVKAVSISGYEQTSLDYNAEGDGSRLNLARITLHTNVKAISQELQLLSSNDSAFSWIVGGFFYHNRYIYDQTVTPSPTPPAATFTNLRSLTHLTSYAAFAQATLEVLTGTKVTGGLRYTKDSRSIDGTTTNQTLVLAPLPLQQRADDKFTYRLAISQQITSSILAYGSASTGFKSGLYSNSSPRSPAVAPAIVRAFEIGVKADLLNHRVRLNLAGFDNKYNNVQVSTRLPDNSGSSLLNAARAHGNGVEADLTAIASSALSFSGGLAYLNSKYRSFPNAPCIDPKPSGLGNITTVCNVSGNVTPQSPKLVLTLGFNYKVETPIGRFSLAATENHNSGYFIDPENRVKSQARDLVNSSIVYTAPGRSWSLSVWVNNALDRHYYSNGQISNNGDLMQVAEPRTYGATARLDF